MLQKQRAVEMNVEEIMRCRTGVRLRLEMQEGRHTTRERMGRRTGSGTGRCCQFAAREQGGILWL